MGIYWQVYPPVASPTNIVWIKWWGCPGRVSRRRAFRDETEWVGTGFLMLTACLILVFFSSVLAENPARNGRKRATTKNPHRISDDDGALSSAQVKEEGETQAGLRDDEMESGATMEDVTKKANSGG
ncbi:TPA: hypothetical protein ACTW94_004451 [Raoultella ornithinolytica]|uniref:hypothetical protein n=2 Tax=Raoultella ornithinolytica TaxID=54291 RepID=UPI0025A7A125|nr:hypothetical protein [Raoultella ornithinolytica]EKW1876023.1 hypothetical protein [Raoultella ornithinolytica]ELS5402307.1 hypothetical protein [Raoultella ornithinolytica]MDV1094027.1 hypothetical protein [Raoultella ornithinolytica]MDV1891985.1 hypothetical protein [Raoultella ornithinolytica]ULI45607.1 hypothetical protein HUZ43_16480 [Raoultella ornithinolytica]